MVTNLYILLGLFEKIEPAKVDVDVLVTGALRIR